MTERIAVIIPARYASQRLPGKPLLKIAGKPMIQWVYERAKQIPGVGKVVVATDDERISEAVTSFGGEAYMTPVTISNGSERVGAVAENMQTDIIVNLQGDEPLISPDSVGRAIQEMNKEPNLQVTTLGYPLRYEEEWHNPAVVKILVDNYHNAIYFSRAAIPFPRDNGFRPIPLLMRHIGIYVYRKHFLLQFLNWPRGILEEREKLEQLRILERGYKIRVIKANEFSPGVDTAEDILSVEKIIQKRGLK